MIQVFSKEWFELRQKHILWFANSWVGRRFFGITQDIPKDKKLIEMLPYCMTWQNDNGTFSTDFRTHDKFAKRLYHGLKPLWLMLHGWDFVFGQKAQELNFGFDTLTAFPDANPETTTVDGWIRRNGIDETFATIRAGAGVGANDSETNSLHMRLVASTTSDQYGELRRSFYLFDTSSLTGSASISAATLSLWGTGKSNGLGSPAIHIAGATTASNTSLATGDFVNRGTTSFGNVAYASFTATDSAYSDVALNASGLANIVLTGVSKFSGQLSWDVLNDTTGLTWMSSETVDIQARTADDTGTSNDPKLVVTYSLPTTSTSSTSTSQSTSTSVSTSISTSSTSASTSSTSSSISTSTSSTSTSMSTSISTSSTSSSISTSTSQSTSSSVSTSTTIMAHDIRPYGSIPHTH